ncbi:terC, partial [Symbiodinium necroappetens]
MASEAAENLPAESPSTPLAALWIAFLVSIFVVAGIDFCCINGSGRCACMPTYGKQILLWVLAGLGFAAFVMQVLGAAAGGSWMYGYFLEYMLSIDNLFVFQLVFKGYSTPECHVDRALFWGIVAAVLLRLGFFGIGTEILQLGLVARVFFGLLLMVSGWKAFSDSEEEDDPSKNPAVRCIARLLPLHDQYSERAVFFVWVPRHSTKHPAGPTVLGTPGADVDGIRLKDMVDGEDVEAERVAEMHSTQPTVCKVTPLFLVVLTLAIIDVIFAVDSVTAKISSVVGFHPDVSFFLNLSSSAFAMFVLRSLYLVVDLLTHMFRFLPYGVGAVLLFIGLKLIVSHWFEVGMLLSSVLILSLLLLAIVASVVFPKADEEDPPQAEDEEPEAAPNTRGHEEAQGRVQQSVRSLRPKPDAIFPSCTYQWMECAQFCLQFLVLLAALRRSFFQKELGQWNGDGRGGRQLVVASGAEEEDRTRLLASMMQGTTAILASKMGLQEHACYHELCRLLGKINATHQLNELCANEQFQAWIEQVYGFTMDSLRRWEVMPNSKHYLLGFWAAMVSPVILLQDKAPKALESFIQQIPQPLTLKDLREGD